MVFADSVDGALVLVAVPSAVDSRIDGTRGAFTVTMWLEDAETVRLSLRSLASGAVAYVQGGSTLMALAAELGLATAP